MDQGLHYLHPNECMPPHGVSHPNFIVDLANKFAENGWNSEHPALVGYPWEGKVQLLSGTHRWFAATKAELEKIPVYVYPHALVEYVWGTDAWKVMMKTGDNIYYEVDKGTD